ncbi:hypothetical protein FJT64_005329 [Amphibalanus amphitrite]|uniref:Uncharacterized protein n=1 Tax=Amphibalanus amphitrite TaxID=1232801 RepID=A0A6A4VUC9_AMPAM|nr:hypothetical protein FJT64_005329 [Amphibalanus amphitrite]
MVTVRPLTAALCALLVLVCLLPCSNGYILSRMTRETPQQECAVHGRCAFERYDVQPSEMLNRCICPPDTSCVRHYNNLGTEVWTYRCHYVSR